MEPNSAKAARASSNGSTQCRKSARGGISTHGPHRLDPGRSGAATHFSLSTSTAAPRRLATMRKSSAAMTVGDHGAHACDMDKALRKDDNTPCKDSRRTPGRFCLANSTRMSERSRCTVAQSLLSSSTLTGPVPQGQTTFGRSISGPCSSPSCSLAFSKAAMVCGMGSDQMPPSARGWRTSCARPKPNLAERPYQRTVANFSFSTKIATVCRPYRLRRTASKCGCEVEEESTVPTFRQFPST